MGGILFLFILAVGAVLIVWYLRAWNRNQNSRQAGAEAQRQRHGGQAVLEWNGPQAQGAPDPEFGELLVEIPKKSGGGAYFYQRGVTVDGKRLSYNDLKDVAFAERTPGALVQTPKTAAVMWLYPQKGMGKPISLFSMHYQYEDSTMRAIQTGLGYGCS